jgi:hypothetical protein
VSGRTYSVFGLTVRSELPLPELPEIEDGAEADVRIRMDDVVAPADAGFGLHRVDGRLILVIPTVAKFLITAGADIAVQPEPGAPERNVRLYLLGSAFGAMLHQRGILPLHANVVEVHGKTVAFMGKSGAGKSTLAAWFYDHGYRVLADDVCVVRFDADGRAVAAPGLPRLRLSPEAVQITGRLIDGLASSFEGDPLYEKFDVPIAKTGIAPTLPIAAVYLLERGEELSIEPLAGLAAAEAIFANTYRGEFVSVAGRHQEHWATCMRLIRSIPVYRLRRPWTLVGRGEYMPALLAHIRNHRR